MRALSTICLCALLGATACKGAPKSTPTEPTKPVDVAAAKAAAAEPKAEEPSEEAKQQEAQKKVAEALEKAKKDAEEDAKRWTDELRKQTTALIHKDYADSKAALIAILDSPHRKPGNSDRDAHRHPLETLLFFGIQPTMTVIEVGSGGGWYTEILAPLLAKKGKLVASTYNPDGPADSMMTVYGTRFKYTLEGAPELFGKVQPVYIAPPAELTLGAPGTADLAIAIREMHNWHRRGFLKPYLVSIFEVLKPGGTFGVVQHRAKPDASADESAESGYLPEQWLIQQVEAAGFKLVEKSNINNNPRDTKDYEGGVWTLPPSLGQGDKDRDKYIAIGESDRMTLKFVKPAN